MKNLGLLLLLVGCVQTSADDSLLGRDDDKNGVRDDVDVFIQKKFKGVDNINAAKQYAKYRTQLIIFHESRTKLEALLDKLSKSKECYGKLNPKKKRAFLDFQKISVQIENTKERLIASKKADVTMAGTMHVHKDFENEACEFKIKGK